MKFRTTFLLLLSLSTATAFSKGLDRRILAPLPSTNSRGADSDLSTRTVSDQTFPSGRNGSESSTGRRREEEEKEYMVQRSLSRLDQDEVEEAYERRGSRVRKGRRGGAHARRVGGDRSEGKEETMERDQVDPEVERRGGATPPPKLRFDYGGEKVRGVSLGGWLVVEDFITPNVYSSTGNSRIIDEWTFGSLQSKSKATSILQKHLDGFVGEEDFERMASLGLNHVRIPIGYWAFEVGEGEPFLKLNQWNLLKKAAGWAGKNGLKVLVDLHAVPGSANGFDHGGRKGHNEWASKRSYVERTLAILRTMSNEFSKPEYSNSVSAIELVNEPVTDSKVVLDFYKRGYGVVRNSSSPSPLLVVIGDEFKSPALTDYWRKRLTPPEYQGLAIDSHVYTIFDDDSIRLSPSDRVSHYCSLLPELSRANSDHWQLIGEWSPSPTDCAQGLNGRGKGSRYQGDLPGSRGKVGECSSKTGDASHFSKGYKRLLATLWQAQVESYEGGMGWIMWTWKTQSGKAEEWSYLKGVEHGWIPEDPTSRPQGVIC